MNKIIITEDKNEQAKIGRELLLEKSKIYTESLVKQLKDVVRSRLDSNDENDIEFEFERSIYYYWAFGALVDEYFYLDLRNKTVAEIKEYVTTHEKVEYVKILNDVNDKHILTNKYEAYETFKEFYKRDVILVKDESSYNDFIEFVNKHQEFVVKPLDMGLGNGVHKASVVGLTENRIKEFFDNLLVEAKENLIKFNEGKEAALVLEELIDQADEMSAIHPQSINGVRVTTVRVGDEVHIYHPWFKIGRGGQFVTSAVYGTFDAGIDPNTGKVVTPGYNETCETFDIHPDTNIPIVGFQIPKWDEAVEFVTELAKILPNVRYTGWDIVLSKKGWCVMEGNFTGDFMWQVFENKGNKKEFEDMLGWKLEKDFWWE